MQTSEYFDLSLYEGTDIFNPLMVENENIEKIDEQMFLNSIAGVGQATELKSGTVHAITRVNPDASMFRFVATSKFDRGDTFTVDGIQVTGLRTDGKALDDGAYVINANVLCCLTGTVLTLFVATGDVAKADDADRLGGELPSYYGTASDVQQAVTVAQAAGVLANDLQGQVTDIETNVSELSQKVDNISTAPDYSNILQDITNTGLVTVNHSGWLIGYCKAASNEEGYMNLNGPDGTRVFRVTANNYINIFIPVKQGQSVYFRSGMTVSLKVYGA